MLRNAEPTPRADSARRLGAMTARHPAVVGREGASGGIRGRVDPASDQFDALVDGAALAAGSAAALRRFSSSFFWVSLSTPSQSASISAFSAAICFSRASIFSYRLAW